MESPGSEASLIYDFALILLKQLFWSALTRKLRGPGYENVQFNKLTSVFHASVLLLIMNFVITLSK